MRRATRRCRCPSWSTRHRARARGVARRPRPAPRAAPPARWCVEAPPAGAAAVLARRARRAPPAHTARCWWRPCTACSSAHGERRGRVPGARASSSRCSPTRSLPPLAARPSGRGLRPSRAAPAPVSAPIARAGAGFARRSEPRGPARRRRLPARGAFDAGGSRRPRRDPRRRRWRATMPPTRHVALEACGRRCSRRQAGEDAALDARPFALLAERLGEPHDRACAAELLAEIAVQLGTWTAAGGAAARATCRDHDPRVRMAVLRFDRRRPPGHARPAGSIDRLAADDEAEAAAAAAALCAPSARGDHRLCSTRCTTASAPSATPARRAARHARHAPRCGRRSTREMPRRPATAAAAARTASGHASDLVLQRLAERIAEGLHTILLLLAAPLTRNRSPRSASAVRARDRRKRARSSRGARGAAAARRARPAAAAARERTLGPAPSRTAARALGRELPSFDDAVRETALPIRRSDASVSRRDPRRRTRGGLIAEAGAPQGTAERGVTPGGDLERSCAGPGATGETHAEQGRDHPAPAQPGSVRAPDDAAAQRSGRGGARGDLPAGGTIVREGEFGDCMYIIVEGEVRVTPRGEVRRRPRPGGLLRRDGGLRRRDPLRHRDGRDRVRLLRLERRRPAAPDGRAAGIAIAVCQTLSRRVRDLIDRLEDGVRLRKVVG